MGIFKRKGQEVESQREITSVDIKRCIQQIASLEEADLYRMIHFQAAFTSKEKEMLFKLLTRIQPQVSEEQES